MPRIADKPSAGLAMTRVAIARLLGCSAQAVECVERAAIRKLWNAGARVRAKKWYITARRNIAATDGR